MATKKSTAPTVLVPTRRVAWRRGVELALELTNYWDADLCVLGAYCRNGAPQYNIVADYLNRLRALQDPAAEAGFTAVLSDFIVSASSGGVPDNELLEELAKAPIAMCVQEPTSDDTTCADQKGPVPTVPRYIQSLCSLARSVGLMTAVRIDQPLDGETTEHLVAEWTGTEGQFRALGFVPRHYRFPITRQVAQWPNRGGMLSLPIVAGDIAAAGDGFKLTIDFGPRPTSIETLAGVEVMRREDSTVYHGRREELLAQSIAVSAQLPTERRTHRSGWDHEEMSLSFASRLLPDGTILLVFHNEIERDRLRTKHFGKTRKSRPFGSESEQSKRSKGHLRLVVDNTPSVTP